MTLGSGKGGIIKETLVRRVAIKPGDWLGKADLKDSDNSCLADFWFLGGVRIQSAEKNEQQSLKLKC